MANSKSKGDRRERQAEELISDVDFITERPNKTGYQQTVVDFFDGLFDILAVKPGEKVLCVQVKSNRARGINNFVEEVQEKVPLEHCIVQFWVCYDTEGWRVIEINDEGYETVYDERDDTRNMGDALREEYLTPKFNQ